MVNVDHYRSPEVAAIVRELHASRLMQGISITALSEKAGLPRQSLGMWERGESQPHLGPLKRWAQALGYVLKIDIE